MKPKSQNSLTVKESEKAIKVRSRAKYRCPTEVDRLIKLVNSVPPNRDLPHWQMLLDQVGGDRNKQRALMEEKLKGVPEDFYNQVASVTPFYNHFRLLRIALRDLANLALVPIKERPEYLKFDNHYEHVEKFYRGYDTTVPLAEREPEIIEKRIEPPPEFFEKFKKYGVRFWHHYGKVDENDGELPIQPHYHVWLTLADDNKVKIQLGAYTLHHLVGVDISRLRVCEVCEKLYWAKQHNSRTCSTPCAKALAVRDFRSREREQKKRAVKRAK